MGTQNSEVSFCTPRSQTHYRKIKAQSSHFPVQPNSSLPMKHSAGTHKLSMDTSYPKHGNPACSRVRKVKNGTHRRRRCAEDILHHSVHLDGNFEQNMPCYAYQHWNGRSKFLGDKGTGLAVCAENSILLTLKRLYRPLHNAMRFLGYDCTDILFHIFAL